MDQQPLTRHQRREMERRERKERAQRTGRTRTFRSIVVIVIVAGGVVAGVVGLMRLGGSGPPKEDLSPFFKGTFSQSQGRDHIPEGSAHDPYSTNPPTSGPHYEEPLAIGIYDEQQPDERIVHNLEHGHIWVSYNCSEECPELVQQLENVLKRHSLYVLEPRTENQNRIALVAWEYYDTFDEFDEKRIEAFFQQREDKGPEKLPPSAHRRK